MRSLAARTFLAITLAKQSRAFAPFQSLSSLSEISGTQSVATIACPSNRNRNTKRFMSSGAGEPIQVRQIDREAMLEIIEDIENSSREESGYVIIDVRNEDEIAYTGKLADCVETLPLPLIAQMGAFTMSEEDFEESFGFAKPGLDETLVLTCKAGIRSMHAAQFAAMIGYTNIVNYSGGSNDWFR